MTSPTADFGWFIRELHAAADSIREGESFQRLPERGSPEQVELCRAFNEVIDAVTHRERERHQIVERNQDVLLALEELARDQAAVLSRQNEDLRRQNEELVTASRLKNEFLATMSHELRTPLNAVIGFSELLLEGIGGELRGDQAEFLRDIHRAGHHLLSMINDILDLAKLDAGRMEVVTERVDLHGVVKEAVEIARPMALRRSQALTLEGEGPLYCQGDPARLRQVALNLLSNAVKFSPRSGRIGVRVRSHQGRVELRVKDSGIGIDPAHHAFIFEAFRQIDGSETREYPGTGLGLALVKKFVEAMGGTVEVESRLGEGASFFVRLPPAAAPGLEAPVPEARPA